MENVRSKHNGFRGISGWLGVLLLGLWWWLGAAPAALAVETVTYYHLDALGSPVAATDAQGALLWREAYAPHGARLRNEHGGGERLGYTAKPEEAAFGLNYFGARWYAPALGRFLGLDPVAFQADNIHSFNRYAYANNNPYRYVDPDGRLGTLVHALQRGVSLEQAARLGQAGTAALGYYGVTGYLENVASGTYARQTLARYGELLDGVMRGDPNAMGALVNEIGIPGSVAKGPIQHTKHSLNQKINREVKSIDELDAVRNPLKKTDVKFDSHGRPSEKFIGEKATVAINPETGKVVTVHPTSSKLAERLKRQGGGQ